VRAGTGWKRLLALELSAFGFFGLFWGCFAVLLADLSGSLGLSPGPLGLAAIVGGSGVAVFYGAEALGRLTTGWIVGRVGNRRTLLGSGLLAAGGMLLTLATTSPALVVGGFLLVGLALAAVAPLAFSVAGDLVPERAGSAISVVTTFGYGGFLLGPPLVGGLAEVVGLRAALGVIVVAGLAVFILSLRLREDQQKSVTS
jgi:MFS family permease